MVRDSKTHRTQPAPHCTASYDICGVMVMKVMPSSTRGLLPAADKKVRRGYRYSTCFG